MPYFKFRDNDLFVNTIEAYPDVKFYIQSGSVYINDRAFISGTMEGTIDDTAEIGVPRNYISLYEYNINRGDQGSIYPFVVKDGQKTTFKSISKIDWNTQFNYGGNQITSSYNLSSSITRYRITSTADTEYKRLRALTNTINHYRYLSAYYDFGTYYSGKEVNMINIPSIFYGSSIKKGSVSLKYYISGTLAAQASDTRYNGALIQVSGGVTGQIVGTVLYNEGIILLTSSVQISNEDLIYETTTSSSWCRFGFGSNDGTYPRDTLTSVTNTQLTASYAIEFQGTNHVQTMTMLAKAPYAQLNHSNNPTYLKNSAKSLEIASSGTYEFKEGRRYLVNVVPSDYTDVLPPMQKETYISKIALYDDQKNVIGYAKLATPVRKTEEREFIFKLKLDL
tara:strand:- start:684 stop:1865 length:1182 start_codon:yes stop_codon:yes gene_type:complete